MVILFCIFDKSLLELEVIFIFFIFNLLVGGACGYNRALHLIAPCFFFKSALNVILLYTLIFVHLKTNTLNITEENYGIGQSFLFIQVIIEFQYGFVNVI